MKKITIAILFIAALIAGAWIIYRSLVPQIIASAVVSDSLPAYIPGRFQTRVNAIRKPLTKGTEAMLETMRSSDIEMEQVLKSVDRISEEDAYAFLDELNNTKPTSTNQVFDIAKKHFSADFDPEVFREPFNKHFKMQQINYAISYANLNRKSNDVDITTAKAILKNIILEKANEASARP